MFEWISGLYACGGICTTTDWVVTGVLVLFMVAPCIWIAIQEYFWPAPSADYNCD